MTEPSPGTASPLAVFDLGKTNSKMFVFAPTGAILREAREKPLWTTFKDRKVLNEERLLDWMRRELVEAVNLHGVGGVMVSAHGCTFALVSDDGELLHPILDYEQEVPDAVAASFDTVRPAFAETFTPDLPLGLCYGRHVFWLSQVEPEIFQRADAILGYPQYWGWRFSGRLMSEYSYLGVHSHLWAPFGRDYSAMVDRLGWRGKFPPLVPSGAVAGRMDLDLGDGSRRGIQVHNGVHDSNAALAYYRLTGLTDFTLVSTGTWVIVVNPACPIDALDAERDMLCNVTVDGDPAPSLRFMGGRENDVIGQGWKAPVGQAAIEAVIARGVFALPSWDAGGPFPELKGVVLGGPVAGEERAALAALYVALMTDLALDLLHSTRTIVLDGGLTRIALYPPLVAQLRPGQKVLCSTTGEGTAMGAAALAFADLGLFPFKDETRVATASAIPSLSDYRNRWRELADTARRNARAAATRKAS